MKRTKILLTVFILVCVLSSGIMTTYGYFTANTQSSGGLSIKPIDTDMTEDYGDWKKVLTISVSPDSAPVYVRARGYSGVLNGTLSYSGEGWSNGGDGWMYYNELLIPNNEENAEIYKDRLLGKTLPLTVDISKVFPPKAKKDENVNVVVVYESVLPMDGVEGAQATFKAFIQGGGN